LKSNQVYQTAEKTINFRVDNEDGVGYGEFIGRFNIETFIVAPGVAAAPSDPFHDPKRILDATQNPATNPVQLYGSLVQQPLRRGKSRRSRHRNPIQR
jgi:hypothetical protein